MSAVSHRQSAFPIRRADRLRQTPASGERLTQKLERAFRLTSDDRSALERVTARDVRFARSGEEIVTAGSPPRGAILVLDGAACRYKQLADGRRQIAAFMLPGDMCDPRVWFLKAMDHSIAATDRLAFAVPSWADVSDLTSGRPKLTRAILWAKQVDEAIAREWAVSLGQRTATERVAHLICELHVRMERVGLADQAGFKLPMTQAHVAAALGLSVVHTNRVLQELRSRKLIRLRGRDLTILNFVELAGVALFRPDYLHLGFEAADLGA